MNTKEAVAQYGLWATVAGFSAWARSMDRGSYQNPGNGIKKSLELTQHWAAGAMDDTEYDIQTVKAIQFRAKLRQP